MKSNGHWEYTKEGLKIFDISGDLIDLIKNDKLEKVSDIIGYKIGFDYHINSIGDTGDQNLFKSDKDEEIENKEREYEQNHCGECDRKLKKTVYSYNNKSLCPYCYREKDTWFNSKFKVSVSE